VAFSLTVYHTVSLVFSLVLRLLMPDRILYGSSTLLLLGTGHRETRPTIHTAYLEPLHTD